MSLGLADDQFERSVRAFKLIALVLQFLHALNDLRCFRLVFLELDAELGGLLNQTAAPGHFTHGDVRAVADKAGVYVFVAGLLFAHGVGVHSALVGECVAAHKRRAIAHGHVGQLCAQMRQVRQARKLRVGHHVVPHLQLQVCNHGAEVGIARAFSVTVDRPLHLGCAFDHRHQRIRYGTAAVVVRVDTNLRGGQVLAHGARRGGDFVRQPSAVGLAKDQAFRACLVRSLQYGQRVSVVLEVAVEEMLRIQKHATTLGLQVRHGLLHNLEVLVQRDAEYLGGMYHGRLGENRDDLGARAQERLDILVVFDGVLGIARGTKGRHLGVAQIEVLGALEEFHRLGVRTGLTAFNIGNAEIIQRAYQRNLVVGTEFYAGSLCAIAQGRIVDFDVLRHELLLQTVLHGQRVHM